MMYSGLFFWHDFLDVTDSYVAADIACTRSCILTTSVIVIVDNVVDVVIVLVIVLVDRSVFCRSVCLSFPFRPSYVPPN